MRKEEHEKETVEAVKELGTVFISPEDIGIIYGKYLVSDRGRRQHLYDIREHFKLRARQRVTIWQLAEYEGIPAPELIRTLKAGKHEHKTRPF